VAEGKSKYVLNGRTETADKVKAMFMAIQLNVNNPHFMVMQGRIAQVIDMKPLQILSLVEEASGTSLYENRKLASLKIIQKKQLKVDEISSIVLQEIEPQLERLRKEKEVYIKYKSNETEATQLWK
jgi:structural maintenance of chromosome 2